MGHKHRLMQLNPILKYWSYQRRFAGMPGMLKSDTIFKVGKILELQGLMNHDPDEPRRNERALHRRRKHQLSLILRKKIR